jgi:hypothetical protein
MPTLVRNPPGVEWNAPPSFVQSIGVPVTIGFPHRRHLPGHFANITTIADSDLSRKQMIAGRDGSAAESTDLPRKSGGAFRRFLGHARPMHDRARYPQGPRRVPHGQVPGSHDIGQRQIRRRTPESLAGRTDAGEASAHPFRDARPLKFGEGARTCNCSRPAAVVQSIPSPSDTNGMPTACTSSSSVTRCFKLRPRRSNRQTTNTSNRRRLASATSRSRAGRRSVAPLTARSTNSTTVQPRASTYRRNSINWFSHV